MPRLHKSSWVVAALTLVLCALIVLPGQITESHFAPYPRYSHGWPSEFLNRKADNEPRSYDEHGNEYVDFGSWLLKDPPPGPPWLSWDSWRFWHAKETTWKPLHLVLDSGIAFAIVASVTAAWEFRRRRRANAFQFRLTDFFVGTAVVAMFLFWLQSHWNAHQKEQQAIEFLTNLNESGIHAGGYKSDVNHAPAWLQRLVGPGYFLDSFIRYHEVDIYKPGELSPEQMEAIVSHLSHFQYLQTVKLSNPEEFAKAEAELRAAIREKFPHVKFED